MDNNKEVKKRERSATALDTIPKYILVLIY